MYLMQSFVDTSAHTSRRQAPYFEYLFKLWMAHGVTTITDLGSMNGLDWELDEIAKSAKNEITAPHIKAYAVFGQGSNTHISTPEQAVEWVRKNAKNGSDGIKFFGAALDIMTVALKENKRLELRSKVHHIQLGISSWNVLQSARVGLTSMAP